MAAASRSGSGSGAGASIALKIIFVSHAGVSRPLALVPDLPVSEMNAIIQAQFALETNVVALVSARRDAVYPLSLLAKSTRSLARTPPHALFY